MEPLNLNCYYLVYLPNSSMLVLHLCSPAVKIKLLLYNGIIAHFQHCIYMKHFNNHRQMGVGGSRHTLSEPDYL